MKYIKSTLFLDPVLCCLHGKFCQPRWPTMQGLLNLLITVNGCYRFSFSMHDIPTDWQLKESVFKDWNTARINSGMIQFLVRVQLTNVLFSTQQCNITTSTSPWLQSKVDVFVWGKRVLVFPCLMILSQFDPVQNLWYSLFIFHFKSSFLSF